jgi:hypothetical protein
MIDTVLLAKCAHDAAVANYNQAQRNKSYSLEQLKYYDMHCAEYRTKIKELTELYDSAVTLVNEHSQNVHKYDELCTEYCHASDATYIALQHAIAIATATAIAAAAVADTTYTDAAVADTTTTTSAATATTAASLVRVPIDTTDDANVPPAVAIAATNTPLMGTRCCIAKLQDTMPHTDDVAATAAVIDTPFQPTLSTIPEACASESDCSGLVTITADTAIVGGYGGAKSPPVAAVILNTDSLDRIRTLDAIFYARLAELKATILTNMTKYSRTIDILTETNAKETNAKLTAEH